MWDLGRDMGLVFVIFCIFVRKDGGFRLHAYAARHTFWGAALIEAPMELLTLDQVKRKELEILKYVVAVCQRLGCRYYLSYGSLLGAIRHRGFIPWDDDIDISMPRADFNKFQAWVSSAENADGRFVTLHPGCKGYPYHYIKVVDTTTRLIDTDLNDFAGNGLWIDIFPLDGVNTREVTTQKKLAKYFNACRASATFKACPPGNKPWRWRVCKWLGPKFFARLTIWCSARLAFDEGEYVAHIPTATSYLFPRRLFSEVIEVEFEGCRFTAPKHYDEYLRILYGDYMQIPPEDQRLTHCVKAVEVKPQH